jgi:hypothetical protein
MVFDYLNLIPWSLQTESEVVMKLHTFALTTALSACSAVSAMAQNVNAIVSYTFNWATPYSLNGINYPAVTANPGTTSNGSTIAVGNINLYPGMFAQNGGSQEATVTFTPINFRGALGFVNGQPICFIETGAGIFPDGTILPYSIVQAANGDWQITVHIQDIEDTTAIGRSAPFTTAQLEDTSAHQLHFFCAAKGPGAPAPQ